MKKTTLLVLTLASGTSLFAEPIDSPVIHNYSYAELGYAFVYDIGNSGADAHGVVGGASYEVNNFLIGVSGDYFGVTDLPAGVDMDVWGIGAQVGYAVRLMENRVNLIPHVGIGYSEATIDNAGFGSITEDSTTFSPGLSLSYAVNNRWSVGAGYNYSRDLEEDLHGHSFNVGTRIALTDRIGLNLGVSFVEDSGFAGVSSTLTFHF